MDKMNKTNKAPQTDKTYKTNKATQTDKTYKPSQQGKTDKAFKPSRRDKADKSGQTGCRGKAKPLRSLRTFNIRLCRHLYINIWFLPVLLCAVLGDYLNLFAAAYICALCHELAHVGCARALGVPISSVTVYPFGVAARLKSGYIRSSAKEFAVAFAGPFASLLLFWISCAAGSVCRAEIFFRSADINLAICIINLVPALPLDGGRMLKSILTSYFGIIRAYNFMLRLSRTAIVILLTAAAVLFFVSGFNFSLILIAAFLLQNLCAEQEAITVITLKEILSTKNKLSDFTLPSRTLCADSSRPAREILRYLTYDSYCTVNVMGENSEIIKTLTETQILSALTESGIRTRYRDIV